MGFTTGSQISTLLESSLIVSSIIIGKQKKEEGVEFDVYDVVRVKKPI